MRIKSSRRRPLPPGVVKTPKKIWYPRVALVMGSHFVFWLTRIRRSDHRKFLERRWSLSLSNPFHSLSFLFSLSFTPLQRLGQVGQVGEYSSCHMSAYYWLIWITSHPLSIIVDFHPLRSCHMSTWAPLFSPGLTNSVHDLWHILSH